MTLFINASQKCYFWCTAIFLYLHVHLVGKQLNEEPQLGIDSLPGFGISGAKEGQQSIHIKLDVCVFV